MKKRKEHPILDSLLLSGTIKIIDREYVGLAADGVEVLCGNVGDENQLERYLMTNPTPDTW